MARRGPDLRQLRARVDLAGHRRDQLGRHRLPQLADGHRERTFLRCRERPAAERFARQQ